MKRIRTTKPAARRATSTETTSWTEFAAAAPARRRASRVSVHQNAFVARAGAPVQAGGDAAMAEFVAAAKRRRGAARTAVRSPAI